MTARTAARRLVGPFARFVRDFRTPPEATDSLSVTPAPFHGHESAEQLKAAFAAGLARGDTHARR